MSAFSERLHAYVTRADMKIAVLSKLSGVDRSFIQKMLSGERIPSDTVVLSRLSDALMLTPAERRSLREAYSISRMGEEVYHRRSMVKRLLEDADSYYFHTPVFSPPSLSDLSPLPDVLPLQGKGAVTDGLRMLLDRELSVLSPKLSIVMQPDCPIAVILHNCCRAFPSLEIQHVLRFDNELQYQKENQYNIRCIHDLLPFLLSPCTYSGWFYYDFISEEQSRDSVFPWFILGQKSVLSLSYDCKKGILYSQPHTVSLFQQIFSEIQTDCLPLFELMNTETSQFWDHRRWPTTHHPMTYSLQYEPCWAFFYSMDIVESRLRDDLPNRAEILSFFTQRREQISLLEGTMRCTAFFTMDGLDSFLKSGRLSELPDKIYSPLTLEQRAELFRRMIACIHQQRFIPYLVRPQKFRIPKGVSFFVADDQHLSCCCLHPSKGPIAVTLREKSVVYSICDFLEYLPETDLIYSRQESEDLLRSRLAEFISTMESHTKKED